MFPSAVSTESSETSEPGEQERTAPDCVVHEVELDSGVVAGEPGRVRRYLEQVQQEGVDRVKMFLVITLAYLIFWGPLFLVTLVHWDWNYEQAYQLVLQGRYSVRCRPSSRWHTR